MKIAHVYDSSYIYHYVLDILYCGKVLNVNDIVYEFEYHKSSIYKLIKKIEYNLETINSDLILVKICPGKYKFMNKNEYL